MYLCAKNLLSYSLRYATSLLLMSMNIDLIESIFAIKLMRNTLKGYKICF